MGFTAWSCLFFLIFIAFKPNVKSMSLEYEPASEPLHISVMHLCPTCSCRCGQRGLIIRGIQPRVK